MGRRNTLIALGATLVLIGSLVSIYVTQCARPETASLRSHVALGQVLAEETAKLLANRGRVVIVTADLGRSPTLKAEVESFTKSIRKQPGIAVDATEVVQPDEKRKSITSRQYRDILEDHPHADAIVSFVGVPRLDDQLLSKPGDRIPKLIAVSRTRSKLDVLFTHQVLQVAVVPRFVFPAPVAKPRNDRDWFDKYYQVVKTVADLGMANPTERTDH